MKKQPKLDFVNILKIGALGGITLLFLALVGLMSAFVERDIIYQTLSLSFALVLITNFIFGYLNAQKNSGNDVINAIASGFIGGLVGLSMLIALVLIAEPLNLRVVLVNASPDLIDAVTFGHGATMSGLLPLIGLGLISSLIGAIVYVLPPFYRRAVIIGMATVLVVGTLEELVSDIVSNIFDLFGDKRAAKPLIGLFFARKGLSVQGAALTLILIIIISVAKSWQGENISRRFNQLPAQSKQGARITAIIIGLLLAVFLPNVLGSYLIEIVAIVGIYAIMGFGLNIVVGYAGLLDLGYVAFFAIGAYVMALLTSIQLPQTTEITGPTISFWVALPIAVAMAVLWGIMLGVPVLRMRGDYLAIVTLGFGEIIRVLALSNFLQPKIGGAQGILGIPKPIFFGIELTTSNELYYLIIVGCLLAAFLSRRMRDSRVGRSWMALREDEDVAEAMGINLVKTKLLAFATGAGLSGLAGAIFAAKLGSIYPHSFNLLISVNVLCLIIVGGLGSLPGVVVGSIILVGLPELLREFSEFRMLIFGALLVGMMLIKPEGFWPAAAQKRELHEGDENAKPVSLPETA